MSLLKGFEYPVVCQLEAALYNIESMRTCTPKMFYSLPGPTSSFIS